VLHTTEPDKTDTATRNLRDAQALEKQRLQAEQQAAQAARIRLNTPSAPLAAASPSNVNHNEPSANKGNRREKGKGKNARKPNNPYFTAVDPTAAPKKKSTAKAVPASSNP
jgi:type II secretory pathway pseudopilin PulG